MRRSITISIFALLSMVLAPAAAAYSAGLVANGNFEGGSYSDGDDTIPNGWTKQEGGGETSVISVVGDNGPRASDYNAVHFLRANGGASGDCTLIGQDVDIPAKDYLTLGLRLDVKVLSHDLCGGGWMGAQEYPITVVLTYEDSDGIRDRAQVGWYLHTNAGCDATDDWTYWTSSGRWAKSKQVSAGKWYAECIDLMDPRLDIARITRIEVGGTGWNFEGRVDNVAVVGLSQGRNGDFEGGSYADGDDRIPNGWTKQESPGETSVISVVADNGPGGPGSGALHFLRANGGASGDCTLIRQDVDIATEGFLTLRLRLDVKVLSHDLCGGGWTGAQEYPVTVVLSYEDSEGKPDRAQVGWYLHTNDGCDATDEWTYWTSSGRWARSVPVNAGVWYPAECIDLLDPELDIARVTRIEVGGTGWSFEGRVDNLAIVGQAQLKNGDFEGCCSSDGDDSVPEGWTKQESPGETSVISLVADNGPSAPGSNAVHFLRANGGASGDGTLIRQDVDISTEEFVALELRLDVQVLSHDLCGGGWMGAQEYPVTVVLTYEDSHGNRDRAQMGWYLHTNAGCDATDDWTYWTSSGRWAKSRQVDPNAWYAERIDLLEPTLDIARITRVEVGGTGWSFEGRVDDVAFVGQGPQAFRRGDVNEDGAWDLSDPIALLSHLFIGGGPPISCEDAADGNDDGALDLADAIYLLSYLYTGGAPPPPPFHSCCHDPTDDNLTCRSFAPCE